MGNSVTLLFGRGILWSSVMMEIHCTTEEGELNQNWRDLDEGEESEFSAKGVVNE